MVGAQTLKDDMFNIKHGRHINVTQMTSLGKSFAVTPAVLRLEIMNLLCMPYFIIILPYNVLGVRHTTQIIFMWRVWMHASVV